MIQCTIGNKSGLFVIEALWGRCLTSAYKDIDTLGLRSSVKLDEAWGKPEKAEEWRAKWPQTEAVEE